MLTLRVARIIEFIILYIHYNLGYVELRIFPSVSKTAPRKILRKYNKLNCFQVLELTIKCI
jgi:hypothetical protein